MNEAGMKLEVLPGRFTVCKVPDLSEVAWKEEFLFLGKTDQEISVVCREEAQPQNAIVAEQGWKAFRIGGILDFSLVGILARLSGLLAGHQISIFAVSTYDTDYILIKEAQFLQAVPILEEAGYRIENK